MVLNPATVDTIRQKLDEVAQQFDELERQLADPAVVSDHQQVRILGTKRAALAGIVGKYRALQRLEAEAAEAQNIIDATGDDRDAELIEMAEAELPELQAGAAAMMEEISSELVTADDAAIGSVILEVRAGTGGAEAALFAGELLEVYQNFAKSRGWKFEVLDFSAGDQGGIRGATAAVSGEGVWQGLGYESGVHCVKRVPATETQGRVHTSTAAVLDQHRDRGRVA